MNRWYQTSNATQHLLWWFAVLVLLLERIQHLIRNGDVVMQQASVGVDVRVQRFLQADLGAAEQAGEVGRLVSLLLCLKSSYPLQVHVDIECA